MRKYLILHNNLALPFSLLICVLLSACSKESAGPTPSPDPVPVIAPSVPKPSAIKGILNPATAAVRVICTPSGGGTAINLENPGNNFKLNDVPAGNYSLTVIPKLGYTAPAAINIVVASGDTTGVGTINLVANSQSTGYMRFTMDGNAYDFALPDVNCSYTGGVLTIAATMAPTIPYWSFKLNLADVSGVGTFTPSFPSTTSYVEAMHYLPTTTLWFTTSAYYTGPPTTSGRATIEISELNTSTHVVTGTFSAIMPQRGIGGSPKRINNGSFQLNY